MKRREEYSNCEEFDVYKGTVFYGTSLKSYNELLEQYPDNKGFHIIPKGSKIKSCKRCHTQLQPNWVVCPICGESVQDKN